MTLFSTRLKKLRQQRKLTQEDLGKLINVTKVSISGYENGNRTPDMETLQKIADVLEVSLDYLLGRSEYVDGIKRGPWQTVHEAVAPYYPDIAKKMEAIGATNIQLTAELLERGMTREELEQLLQMMINLQKNKNESSTPNE